MKKINLLKYDISFFLMFILFAGFYYDGLLEKGPLNIHLWRQTDCIALTHHYAEGAPFLEPEMYVQLADDHTSGKTAGEFPLLYYLVGKIWFFFGESYFSYRLFYLFILFLGSWAFFKATKTLLNSPFWATVLSALLLTSPVFVVYSVSFLTDAPAFSFILIALYFFLRYHTEKSYRFFFVALCFFALAGLLKISSLIAFVFLGVVLFLELFSFKTLGGKKLYHGRLWEWVGFIGVVLIIFVWYAYAAYYNEIHRFKYTFNDIFPLWLMDSKSIGELLENVKNFTSYLFFSRGVLLVLLVGFVLNLYLRKRMSLFASLANILVFIGGLLYLVLWAPLIGNHDYYFIALSIVFVSTLVPLLHYLKNHKPQIFHSKLVRVVAIVFVGYNFLYCLDVVQLKTTAKEGTFRWVNNPSLVDHLFWVNAVDHKQWKRFEDMRPYLRHLGVQKEDKVISLPDHSFNISLSFLKQKGWSNFANYSTQEEIDFLIKRGARYLLLSDSNMRDAAFLTPFLTDRIGTFKGIDVYLLKRGTN